MKKYMVCILGTLLGVFFACVSLYGEDPAESEKAVSSGETNQPGAETNSPPLISSENMSFGAKQREAMETVSIPVKKFKPLGKIIEYDPEDLKDKTIFSIGDIVKINVGSKKKLKNGPLAQGTLVHIFKIGKLLTDANSLEQIKHSLKQSEQSEKRQTMANKIGEGKIITVKKNYSLMQITVAVEPVRIEDYILLPEAKKEK